MECSRAHALPRIQRGPIGHPVKHMELTPFPICGVLIALVTTFTLAEDLFGWRAVEDLQP